MSIIRADSIKNRGGNGAPDFPKGLTVTGVVTATTLNQNASGDLNVGSNIKLGNASGIITATKFVGSGSELTGIDAATLKEGNNVKARANTHGVVITGVATATTFSGAIDASTGTFSGNVTIDGNLGIGGTLTYEDVTRVDALGISTYREGLNIGPLAGIALTAYKDGSIRSTGIITAASFVGDGSAITGIVADVQALRQDTLVNALYTAYEASGNTPNVGHRVLAMGYVDKFMDRRGLATMTDVYPVNGYLCPNYAQDNQNYYRLLKTQQNGGGGYHTDVKWYDGSTGSNNRGAFNADLWTQKGLYAWNASTWTDGNTSTNGFHTDHSEPGSYVELQLAGNPYGASGGTSQGMCNFTKIQVYTTNPDRSVWDVQYSKDGAHYYSAFIDFNTDSGSNAWQEADWSNATSLKGHSSTNATGQAVSNLCATVPAGTSKVGGVILHNDQAGGTTTFGTDLTVSFSCNNGSNWTAVTTYNVTTMQGVGIYQHDENYAHVGTDRRITCVRLGEVTCTAGTQVKWKIDWANQSGSKESRVYGIGLYWS